MNDALCGAVQEWLTTQDNPALPPPSHLVNHVSGCSRCRRALLLLSAAFLSAPPDTESISCEQCQDDLPAYIDYERDEGPQAAIRAYPHVWLHVWTCADCAETYRLTQAALDAVADGDMLPWTRSVSARQAPLLPPIILPRRWINTTVAPQFGASWGADDDTVVADEESNGYQINVALRKRSDGQWAVIVTVDPLLQGEAVLTLGDVELRAALGPDGVATIEPIADDVLRNPSGPDLSVRIVEQNAE